MVASAISLVDMHKLLEQNELLWCIPHKTRPEQMNMDNVTTEVMPRTCARKKGYLTIEGMPSKLFFFNLHVELKEMLPWK